MGTLVMHTASFAHLACERPWRVPAREKKLVQRVVPWEGPGAGEGSPKGLFPTSPLGQSSSRLGDLDP